MAEKDPHRIGKTAGAQVGGLWVGGGRNVAGRTQEGGWRFLRGVIIKKRNVNEVFGMGR
jgi:hypothetical protein